MDTRGDHGEGGTSRDRRGSVVFGGPVDLWDGEVQRHDERPATVDGPGRGAAELGSRRTIPLYGAEDCSSVLQRCQGGISQIRWFEYGRHASVLQARER